MLESLFNKVADPKACFPVNFAKIVYRTALLAATDHSGLYNFASSSSGTSFVKGELPLVLFHEFNTLFSYTEYNLTRSKI